MTKTFKEIIAGIRTAIYGREVREDIAQGMEYVEGFATTAAQKAEESANGAAAAENALRETTTAKTEAVQAIRDEKTESLDAIADTKNAALDDVASSTKTATDAAAEATKQAQSAAASADAAAKSQTAAATSALAAQTSAGAANVSAEKAAEEARKAANYVAADKTLSIPGAPADAKATGDALAGKADKSIVQDESGNAIFYSKAEVEAKIREILAAQREEDLARVRYWVSDDPTSPASFIGGTWERIEDCTIWGASSIHPAGTKLEAGMPSVFGQINEILLGNGAQGDGMLKFTYNPGLFADFSNGSGIKIYRSNIGLNNTGIYGASNTVQPPAYCTYIWRRVA